MAIEIDGKVYRNMPEQVEENANNIQYLLDLLASEGNIMRYKGSVDTYDDLPTEDNKVGDVWNILDTGSNYAWDGEAWDEIGSTVDLSGYVQKTSIASIYSNSSTYAVGDVIFYNDTLYVCNTAITTAEDFDSTKWTEISVSSGFVDLNGAQVISGEKTFSNTLCVSGPSLRPETDNQTALGLTNRRFTVVHCSSIHNDYSSLILHVNGFLNVSFTGNDRALRPSQNNAHDLGGTNNQWRDLYLSGIAYASNFTATNTSTTITWGFSSNQYSNMQFERNGVGMFSMSSSAFFPNSNNTRDLGTSSLRFRDAYIERNISDSTNSVTVEEVFKSRVYCHKMSITVDGGTAVYIALVNNDSTSYASITEANYLTLITAFKRGIRCFERDQADSGLQDACYWRLSTGAATLNVYVLGGSNILSITPLITTLVVTDTVVLLSDL